MVFLEPDVSACGRTTVLAQRSPYSANQTMIDKPSVKHQIGIVQKRIDLFCDGGSPGR